MRSVLSALAALPSESFRIASSGEPWKCTHCSLSPLRGIGCPLPPKPACRVVLLGLFHDPLHQLIRSIDAKGGHAGDILRQSSQHWPSTTNQRSNGCVVFSGYLFVWMALKDYTWRTTTFGVPYFEKRRNTSISQSFWLLSVVSASDATDQPLKPNLHLCQQSMYVWAPLCLAVFHPCQLRTALFCSRLTFADGEACLMSTPRPKRFLFVKR